MKQLVYLLLLFSINGYADSVESNGIESAQVIASVGNVETDTSGLAFKSENKESSSGMWKSFFLVLVLLVAYLGFLLLKPKITNVTKSNGSGVEILDRKVLSPNLVSIHIQLRNKEFLVVQDKHGHSVTLVGDSQKDKGQEV